MAGKPQHQRHHIKTISLRSHDLSYLIPLGVDRICELARQHHLHSATTGKSLPLMDTRSVL